MQLDPGTARQALHGVDEVEVVHLPHEGDDVATLLTAETMEESFLAVDGERRRLLRMERAQPLPALPDLLEGDVLAGDLHEIGCRPHPSDVVRHDPHEVTVSRRSDGSISRWGSVVQDAGRQLIARPESRACDRS